MSESHVATHHELGFVRKYIFSTDHKVIGVQYMITAMFMAIIGGLLSMLMRYQLAWPQAISPMLAKWFPISYNGGVMAPEFYISLVTMHGTS
jgi:cytochrome c oxidase subunit I